MPRSSFRLLPSFLAVSTQTQVLVRHDRRIDFSKQQFAYHQIFPRFYKEFWQLEIQNMVNGQPACSIFQNQFRWINAKNTTNSALMNSYNNYSECGTKFAEIVARQFLSRPIPELNMNLPSLPSAILDPCDVYSNQKLNCSESESARDNLLEAIDRRLPTQARGVKVTVDFKLKHYVLDGKVPSYHVKQLLYRICRQTLAHFSMVDRLFVSSEHEQIRRYDVAELS